MAGPRPEKTYTFAYYCSGHGFGHATRVVALTLELLARSHSVYICTNAPAYVFNSATVAGATYRHAEIDAGIVQPKAYDVARQETVAALEVFLDKRPERIQEEVEWLKAIRADAVLVDAPFLPCAAAAQVGISSIIISNFTFDSCYSYLSVSVEADHASLSPSATSSNGLLTPPWSTKPDDLREEAISPKTLEPYVNQAIRDYSYASLLLRLPGMIPIPAFDTDVPLPASEWTDLQSHSFRPHIMRLLAREHSLVTPYISKADFPPPNKRVIDTPLIVRPVSNGAYTPDGRSHILSYAGVPRQLHNSEDNKVLLVSFGGQNIPRPTSRPHSPDRRNSRSGSDSSQLADTKCHLAPAHLTPAPVPKSPLLQAVEKPPLQRTMTSDHLYLPGAPPALHLEHPFPVRCSPQQPHQIFSMDIQGPDASDDEFDLDDGLLPPGWIAIVCGLSGKSLEEEKLPDKFFAAPRDIYVPDLTAVSDVVLGKLGYGTCSETVATQTPFIYVPRPLFVEEFGLKRLMEQSGTAIPMTREDFEAGRWSPLILEAWRAGREKKAAHYGRFIGSRNCGEKNAATVIAEHLEAFIVEQHQYHQQQRDTENKYV